MNDKEFVKAINAYKVGNYKPLENLVSTTDKVDGCEWYSIIELIQEQRAFNLPIGSHFIPKTLNIFIEALKKVSNEDGRLDISQRIGTNVLAEDPEIFSEFLNLYVNKAITKTSYPITSTLLSINTGKVDKLWENFFFNYIDYIYLDELNDKQVYNIANNTNKIFDLDKGQHKSIAKAIEFDTHYPAGEVLQQILNYVIDFDKYIIPRAKLNKHGRNEERIESCKRFSNIIGKVELEIELNNELATKTNKDKPKTKL